MKRHGRTEELQAMVQLRQDTTNTLTQYIQHAELLERRCMDAEEEAWIMRQRWEEAAAEVDRLEKLLYGNSGGRRLFDVTKDDPGPGGSPNPPSEPAKDLKIGTGPVGSVLGQG